MEGYTKSEIKTILKQFKNKKAESQTHRIGGKQVRFGYMTDTHMGHKCFNQGLYDAAVKEFNKQKVDFVCHSGDICDGLYTNRPGHVFELDHVGADDQVNFAVKQLSKIKQPFYFITGNHEQNTFFKNAGYDVGYRIAEKLKGSTYLGNAFGDIELAYGKKIRMIHPDGGSSYAISYKSQKIVESLDGGTKPEVLLIGHFHKAEYIFYRNIHVIQGGTLESQTPFMKNKGLSSHQGFWIVDMKVSKKGITEIVPKFYPAY